MKNIILFLILAALFAGCVPRQDMLEVNTFRIEKGSRPWIIAHGGAKKLYPENTPFAFAQVQQYNIDALEMDVCLTKDDILVTHHDLTIDRMSNGTGDLIAYTYQELLAFNFGYGFQDLQGNYPYRDSISISLGTLEHVMTQYGNMPLNIELKNRGENGKRAAEKLLELVEKYDLFDQVLIASFSDEILNHLVEISDGKIPISTSEEETKDLVFSGLSAADYLYRPTAVAAQIPTRNSGINLATQRIINACHRRDMAVHYWTINEKEEMRKLIEMGADGLITDRPDLMQEVLTELGF